MSDSPAPFHEACPAPWHIREDEVRDADGCRIMDFDDENPEDLIFWQGIVDAVNAQAAWRPAKGPVTQTWAHFITYMQQTVLLTAVRGPDGIPKYHPCKFLLRWFRRCTLVSSLDGIVLTTPFQEGGGSFMGPSAFGPITIASEWTPHMDRVVDEYLRALDELPHHFQLHFMHAAEIVGYKHPDRQIRAWWHKTYLRLVHDMHLWPETEAQMDLRLGDDRAGWLARNDEATVA